MKELSIQLENIERDESYHTIEIISDKANSRVEKVEKSGEVFIRKYFSREPTSLPKINHPCIPKVYESYRLADKFVTIEEYIEGETLTEKSNTKLTLSQVTEYSLKLCKIVHYLHNQNPCVIHRDIKPDNIIITHDNSLFLIDLGIARTHKTQQTTDTLYAGTVGFAPPEQFGFGQTDNRSDIYGIGMTMFYMLTGVEPKRGLKDMRAILRDSKSPDSLCEIVLKAVAFDPDLRYDNIVLMINDIETHENRKSINTKASTNAKQTLLKHSLRLSTVATVLSGLFAIFFISMMLPDIKNLTRPLTVVFPSISLVTIFAGLLALTLAIKARKNSKESRKRLITAVVILAIGILLLFLSPYINRNFF